jgi:hypothetical protein
LLTAVARSRAWMNDLSEGRVNSFEEIARSENKKAAVEKKQDEHRAVCKGLEAEVQRRQDAVGWAKRKVEEARSEVLKAPARELLALHKRLRAAKERVGRHLRVLSRNHAIAREDEHWDALPSHEPSVDMDTGDLQAVIAQLETDPDVSLDGVIKALKEYYGS